jgi:protein-S-isoprenylcysteine O-methyltransferase Ste14
MAKLYIKPLYFDIINLAFVNLVFFLFYREAIAGLLILRAAIGTPIVLLSFYFESKSCSVLGKPQSHPQEIRKLVTSGIYSKMRHPVYLGRMLMNLGFLIIFPIVPMLIVAIVFVIVWYLMALHEEMFLMKKFGRNYKKYREKVPMFIPKK